MQCKEQFSCSALREVQIPEEPKNLIHNYSILFLPKLKQHISMLFNHMLGICN